MIILHYKLKFTLCFSLIIYSANPFVNSEYKKSCRSNQQDSLYKACNFLII